MASLSKRDYTVHFHPMCKDHGIQWFVVNPQSAYLSTAHQHLPDKRILELAGDELGKGWGGSSE